MVRGPRAEAVYVVTEPGPLSGSWVALEPIGPPNHDEASALMLVRRHTPMLGGSSAGGHASHVYGAPMLIRDLKTADAIGIVENSQMAGYPGVAVVLIFVDQSRARPGIAMEAFAMYLRHVFESGAQVVHLEVLESNEPVLRMLRRIGVSPQVHMREHLYVAGRFHDVLVFGIDRAQFQEIWGRYGAILPGGKRPPAALGGSRPV